MKKIIGIFILLAIGVSAGLFLKSQKEAVASAPVAKARHYSVKTISPQMKTIQETRAFLAQLLASKSALIASKFSAEIKEIYVKENDRVKKGQLLISLDDREIVANLNSLKKQQESLELDVANVKRSLLRNKKLLEAGAIAQEQYDNSNVAYQLKLSALQATQEKIKQTKVQLGYLNIRAPFSGRIGTIFVDAGNLAVPGKPIVSLNSDDQKLIFSYAPTSKPILVGNTVLVDGKAVGIISRKYDDAKNALLVAEIKLTKALPYANRAFVNIEVVTGEMRGCTLPLNALLHRKNASYVMLYREKHFEAKEVELLLHNEEDAIIKECPTERVAVASEAKLALLPSLGEVLVNEEK